MIKRLFSPFILLLAAVSFLTVSCNEKEKSEAYKTLTVYQSGTKGDIEIVGDQVLAQWNVNDALAMYNRTRNTVQTNALKAESSESTTSFKGSVYCSTGDDFAVIFPKTALDTVGSNSSIFYMDIAHQNGTLKSIGEYVWLRYATGQVTESSIKDNKATGYLNSEFVPLLGLAKISFTCEGQKLSNITRVCLSDINTEATFDAKQSASNPTFTILDEKGFIDMTNIKSDDIYVALYPGDSPTNFYVTANGELYEGKGTINTLFNKAVERSFELTKVQSTAYVEVGGVKWATGNFILKDGNWTISNDPTEFIAADKESDTNMDLFVWGGVNKNATLYGQSGDYFLEIKSGNDIEGKLYYDTAGTTREYGYRDAKYGDVIYWATKGKYRMPSYGDFYAIATAQSESIKDIEGIESEFTTMGSVAGYKFTDKTNGNSIFFPAEGYRNVAGDRLGQGTTGRYLSGRSTAASTAYVLYFTKDGVCITDSNVDSTTHLGYKGFGGTLRPVLAQ